MLFRYTLRGKMRNLILLLVLCLLPTAWSDIQFEEVSQWAGITRIGESWGNAWGDFDGDGYLDLWATNHKHKPSLYRNNGDGTFTDIIDEVWDANPQTDTHGVAWADFDNDGDQDLIVLSGGGGGTNAINPKHNNHFYVNEGGMLVEKAAEFGISLPLLRGRSPLWFDWNSDGRLDLLVTGRVRPDETGDLVTASIFEQAPNGFVNVNEMAGFQVTKDTSLAQMSDLTGDGSMEIFMDGSSYPGYVYDIAIRPFKELKTFLKIPAGLYNVQDVAFADVNGDLQTDAFLARGFSSNYVDTENERQIRARVQVNIGEKGFSFKTNGEVRFEIHTVWATRLHHLSIGEAGHRLTAFDGEFIPNDPCCNVASFLFVLNPDDPRVAGLKPRSTSERWGMYLGYDPNSSRWTLLYHTNPGITTNWTGFEALIEAQQPIVEVEPINFSGYELNYRPRSVLLISQEDQFAPMPTFFDAINGRSIAAGDFDNDMDVDLYVVRSSSISNFPNHLYENQGDGTFVELVGAGGAEGSIQGRGQSVTMADYDRDGYLDFFVTNGRGAYPFNKGPDQLFRNISSGNNYLQIDLEGTVSNRDGIGARLFVTTPDGKTQLRENSGGIHWAQQDQKRIHFGLAQNEKVSELTIHWPSGIVQKLTDVSVNQVLHVVEKGVQTSLPGDVNQDGQVDVLDILVVVAHFGENPPTNPRVDTNKDRQVNLDDLVWIIEIIEENQNGAAAPTPDVISNRISALSAADIDLLYAFYQKIEEMSEDATQIEQVRRFLRHLLMPVEDPLQTKLYPSYPNPFNPETWIPYQLAEDTEIAIRIYNTEGKTVRTLFAGHQASGYYLDRSRAAHWDGRNELGEQVASGVYICELTTPTFKQTKRLVVLK
ncbi:T9SS type A sorting domain-containing protein [Candidatus Poribacteria bacterium]|nr:T9SS type A sorting domain-containing protein [Candidatus Poribacteria bacterium]MYH79589.1 T9SS type A sorting domain-containing protein [Candidatus Poribacteria bacterium]MYK96273.1 T9SS type A sorting domain-containing protein [Candidatus Poribacteria bacterium]